MIRIDEIYQNTFWPWIRDHRPGYRVFLCDPFGRSDPDSVMNYGRDDWEEYNYIFFFDQEPIHLGLHQDTFARVIKDNRDIHEKDRVKNLPGYIVTSEQNSQNVDVLCRTYRWRPLYYFFHGWAALDWYRGYDKTFLMRPVGDRRPQKTFISPNRIIGGARSHRLQMLYWIFKLGMDHNHLSCPIVCPVEQVSIFDTITKLPYHDSQEIFRSANLPRQFNDETDHPMHSCWLSLFEESADSLLYLVTETVAAGRRWHLTEKTFKPIALGMPFVLVSTAGSLGYLRSYGFKTFGDIWDESYDLESDDIKRIEKIARVLHDLDEMTDTQRQGLLKRATTVIEHNWNHFYNGGFEQVLWQELQDMMHAIESNY